MGVRVCARECSQRCRKTPLAFFSLPRPYAPQFRLLRVVGFPAPFSSFTVFSFVRSCLLASNTNLMCSSLPRTVHFLPFAFNTILHDCYTRFLSLHSTPHSSCTLYEKERERERITDNLSEFMVFQCVCESMIKLLMDILKFLC